MKPLRDSLGRPIFWVTVILGILGVLSVFSASVVMTVSTDDFNRNPFFFLNRQLGACCWGCSSCAWCVGLICCAGGPSSACPRCSLCC